MSLGQLAASSIAGAAVILLAAYVIRGITSFGSGLIAVPLLALFLPLKFVVPLVLLLDFTASIVIGGLNFKRVKWDEVGILIPFGVAGVVLGTSLLIKLPPEPMLLTLAGFVFLFALRSIFNIHGDKPISRGWAVPASLVGGTVGGLFGTGGPPYVIYLSHRIREKGDLRATFSATFLYRRNHAHRELSGHRPAAGRPGVDRLFCRAAAGAGRLVPGRARACRPDAAADDAAGRRAVAGVECIVAVQGHEL